MSLFIEPLRFLSLKPRRRILHSTPCCWRTTALHHTDLHWAFHQSEPSWSQTGTTPRQNTHLQNNFKFCLKEQKRIKTCEDKSKTIPKHLNKSENNDLDLHLTSFLLPWYLAAVFILTQTEIPADQRTVTYWMTGEILKPEDAQVSTLLPVQWSQSLFDWCGLKATTTPTPYSYMLYWK